MLIHNQLLSQTLLKTNEFESNIDSQYTYRIILFIY